MDYQPGALTKGSGKKDGDYMEDIQTLISNFRHAIDLAKYNGEFDRDFSFNHFPRGCCGDASDLLGEYLLEHEIHSIYVCGKLYLEEPEEGFQSHAWLTVDGLIADITGDQFGDRAIYFNYDIPDYYGPTDTFHRLFEVKERDAHPFLGLKNLNALCWGRLYNLYGKIKRYL